MPRRSAGWYHGGMEHARPALVTYRELRLYPDDLKRRELVDGAVIVAAAPLNPHQKIVGNLHIILACQWERQ
jgi:hypothetical protein